jgi:chitinase
MNIIQSAPPANFMKLGYFEAFNFGRNCLHMDVSQIDRSHTHIHFAFGMLTTNYEIYFDDKATEYHFNQFKKLQGIKRILSFGGWTFSAEAPYYTIFREGVKSANRNRLATNIANFIHTHGLDGVDIDWEYPGVSSKAKFWIDAF